MVRTFEERQNFETEMVIQNQTCSVSGCACLKGWFIPAKISCVDDSYDTDGESKIAIDDDITIIGCDDNGSEVKIELTDSELSKVKEELLEYAERNLF